MKEDQQLRLQLQRKIPDLVEVWRPAIRGLDAADAGGHGSDVLARKALSWRNLEAKSLTLP